MESNTPRRIALVGTAKSGAQAPHKDPSWEIWGVSARAAYVVRANRWFELHRLDGEPKAWAENWRNEMRKFSHDCELIMMYPEPDLGPRITQYPHERMVRRFGTYFMTSTFAWMMAMAIDEMAPHGKFAPDGSEIGIWGVDMEYGTEYRQQRAGFHHFMALAQQLGIKVTRLVDGGLIYEPVPYPMWQDDPLLSKLALRARQNADLLARNEKSQHANMQMIAQNRALLAEFDAMSKPDYDVEKRRLQTEKELEGFLQASASMSKDIVYIQGAQDEQKWLEDYLQP